MCSVVGTVRTDKAAGAIIDENGSIVSVGEFLQFLVYSKLDVMQSGLTFGNGLEGDTADFKGELVIRCLLPHLR